MKEFYDPRNFERALRVGDMIHCPKGRLKINEIIRQDFYKCKYEPERSYIHIDFRTKSGMLHSWKSNLDGGYVEFRDPIVSPIIRDKILKELDRKEQQRVNQLRETFRKFGYSV